MANDAISELAAKGGKARAKALTPERKREIALMGVDARMVTLAIHSALVTLRYLVLFSRTAVASLHNAVSR